MMENSIVNSTFKFAGSHLVNGISIDFNSLMLVLIFISVMLLSLSIFSYVRYKRDKENVPNGTTVENLKKEVKFYSSDFEAINERLNSLEQKQNLIDALYDSIQELKRLIRGGNKDE